MSVSVFTSEIIPYITEDGFPLTLERHYNPENMQKGPVMLVHGAGVSADIFNAPTQENIIQFLVKNGYDVWNQNWRASFKVAEPNEWTLDKVALYDHPAAVKKIVALSGHDKIKAIIHCQGSTSFMLSIVSGLLPNVSCVISNAVSLHPIVTPITKWKLTYLTPLLKPFVKYINPKWADRRSKSSFTEKLINGMCQITHLFEPGTSITKMTSFTYGCGYQVLFYKKNMNDMLYGWTATQFDFVPMTFFKQIRKSVLKGYLQPVDNLSKIIKDIATEKPKTDARFAFITGRENYCFNWKSQRTTYEYFNNIQANYHSYHCFQEYGHLDVFTGVNAARDIFPYILEELGK